LPDRLKTIVEIKKDDEETKEMLSCCARIGRRLGSVGFLPMDLYSPSFPSQYQQEVY